ncbi:putative 5-formyltetrahydrofolate cyclo-ligase [Rhizodiscina lignyota]|uniref:5-formyltetrahydrofolate cyclo-ligase n=1 Tax=Rhizodiscina lignyota TaxID=1504668 RepID=A0A9P4I7H6_9PEZI|nr:putative 5-formyltetrahydrofolate cyclo-ligase [Rhizodiscina lignyota]
MATMQAAKKQLRKLIKDRLCDVSLDSSKNQTSKALETLFTMPQYQNAQRISVYLSMPSGEISTAGIVHDALKNGKEVFVPYTYKISHLADGPGSVMDMVKLDDLRDYEELRPDKWGIPTPTESSIANRINSFGSVGKSVGHDASSAPGQGGLDLIVMPGMAFDMNMNRLGHGRGFYDFFLERLQRHTDTKKGRMPLLGSNALKWSEQLLEESSVPTDSTDWKLDALITGDGQLLTASHSRIA